MGISGFRKQRKGSNLCLYKYSQMQSLLCFCKWDNNISPQTPLFSKHGETSYCCCHNISWTTWKMLPVFFFEPSQHIKHQLTELLWEICENDMLCFSEKDRKSHNPHFPRDCLCGYWQMSPNLKTGSIYFLDSQIRNDPQYCNAPSLNDLLDFCGCLQDEVLDLSVWSLEN